MKKITKLGYTIGSIICILSTLQWWILFYDPSQFAMGFMVGVGVFFFSYIYEWMLLKEEYYLNLEKRIDNLTYGNNK